jgi:hypothetical protein
MGSHRKLICPPWAFGRNIDGLPKAPRNPARWLGGWTDRRWPAGLRPAPGLAHPAAEPAQPRLERQPCPSCLTSASSFPRRWPLTSGSILSMVHRRLLQSSYRALKAEVKRVREHLWFTTVGVRRGPSVHPGRPLSTGLRRLPAAARPRSSPSRETEFSARDDSNGDSSARLPKLPFTRGHCPYGQHLRVTNTLTAVVSSAQAREEIASPSLANQVSRRRVA